MSKIDSLTLPDSSGVSQTYDFDLPVDNRISMYSPYYVTATGTAAVTSKPYYCARWNITYADITSLYDGLTICFRVPVAGHATYGVGISMNSGDYHPVVFNISSAIGTRYGVGSTVRLTYNSTGSGSLYINANSATTVTGCWQAMDYDANTTITYGTIDYYFRPYCGAEPIYRYKLVALDKDNRVVPMTVTNQENTTIIAKTPTAVPFRPEKIWLYRSTNTVSAGAAIGAQTLQSCTYYSSACQYNFNAAVSSYRMIYLRGTFNKTTGLFTLYNDNSSPCMSYYTLVPNNAANLTLSSYFVSGYDYILVGSTYSSNNYFQLFMANPMFHFDGTNLVEYSVSQSITVDQQITQGSTNAVSSGAVYTAIGDIETLLGALL